MKREFLKNFKVAEQELPKEIIDAIMEENGRDIEAAKAKFSDYDDLKTQLTEAGKTIEGFKALDVDGIKNAADEWKAKAEQAEKDAASKIADMEFRGLLTTAITAAKGRNAKAITALLDMDTLKASQNREKDIGAALDGLKKDNDFLFEAQLPPGYAPGTGTKPPEGGYTKETFGKMGYQERLTLKREHPEIYETMKE